MNNLRYLSELTDIVIEAISSESGMNSDRIESMGGVVREIYEMCLDYVVEYGVSKSYVDALLDIQFSEEYVYYVDILSTYEELFPQEIPENVGVLY